MPLQFDPVPSAAALPARCDVVVIGGGIAGVCTALFLAEKGVSVTLCEKGVVGGEQSGRNWGWTRVMGRDPMEIPLSVESLALWRGMNARIGQETGWRQAGILYVCDTAKDLAFHEDWSTYVRQFKLDSRLVTNAEIAELAPGAGRVFAGGMYTPSDGRAEPTMAAPAIARGAAAKGAIILQNCAVRGLETSGGRVSAVVTERGRIACSTAVLAGGAWSRLFLGNLGIDFPQLKMLGSVFRSTPMEGPPELAVGGGDFAFRKRLDGGYTIARRAATESPLTPDHFRLFLDFLPAVKREWHELRLRVGGRFMTEWRTPRRWSLDETSPFEAVRVLDPAPSESLLAEGRANLARAYPVFAGVQVAEAWGGLIDVMPDGVPVISPVEALPGLILSTGYSGHGFGIGPGAGKLTADLVTGDAPIVDPHPFRLSRFPRAVHRK